MKKEDFDLKVKELKVDTLKEFELSQKNDLIEGLTKLVEKINKNG